MKSWRLEGSKLPMFWSVLARLVLAAALLMALIPFVAFADTDTDEDSLSTKETSPMFDESQFEGMTEEEILYTIGKPDADALSYEWMPEDNQNAAVSLLSLGEGTAADIVDIALAEPDGVPSGGDSNKYNGYNGAPWCAYFIVWCARQAGVTADVIPSYYACTYLVDFYKDKGLWHSYSYTPKAGDLIFYSESSGGTACHVGLVTSVADGYVYTKEGNTTDGELSTRARKVGTSWVWYGWYIKGYASPQYATHSHSYTVKGYEPYSSTHHTVLYNDCACGSSKASVLQDCSFAWSGLTYQCTKCASEYVPSEDELISNSPEYLTSGVYTSGVDVTLYRGDVYSTEQTVIAAGDPIVVGEVGQTTFGDWWGCTPDGYVLDMACVTERVSDWPANDDAAVTRLSGSNRYDTMSAIVSEGFADGSCQWAVVTSGENFPDALSAASLAGALDAPIILTNPKSLSAQASYEIGRIGAERVILVGGSGAVSDAVLDQLLALPLVEKVVRVSGKDRYGTACAVYEMGLELGLEWSSTAIVVTGTKYADALSASPYAYVMKSPIFLSSSEYGLNEQTTQSLSSGNFSRVIMVGGEAAVPSSVSSALVEEGLSVERIAGSNRYETSLEFARWATGCEDALGCSSVAFATGLNYPDALAGGALCGNQAFVLLLLDSEDSCALSWVLSNYEEASNAYILGGYGVISELLENRIRRVLGISV